ncbi:alkylhydroperoxidase domain protein [Klebsiella sp. BIGb0407]|uniref:alkylhydroperoxidase domain protein n=1 Tax=Klebsiella sp. BIGb0407 TaxID=2940603 RepID=UPI0021699C55|nr:alkylhydroperoxidase domain protein [Klebsiella sp. BIGb0407]MCS3431446.1 alkylhydroperoxidase domain protein [Klebsiella sp. BIGb0407]
MSHPDLLNQLAEIIPGSALLEARETRHASTIHAQGSYQALFGEDSVSGLTLTERLLLAKQVAEWHEDTQLAEHYHQRIAGKPASSRFAALLDHAERLSFQPVQASSVGIEALLEAGFNEEEIVTLSQIIGFVAFQSRLLRGLRLLGGKSVSGEQERIPGAGEWHHQPHTLSDKSAPQAFTQAELGWEAWLPAKAFSEFNPDEQETLKRFGHQDSDYFRLLGRNLPVLEQRTLTDKGIFFTPGGLPRAERELAATIASKINGCIFCASVHARKAGQLAKQSEAIDKLLAIQPGLQLSEGQSLRWQAEINFSAALSATPATASAQQVAVLREQGLSELELLDLVQSTAFFAWANRLMLTLGEPFN